MTNGLSCSIFQRIVSIFSGGPLVPVYVLVRGDYTQVPAQRVVNRTGRRIGVVGFQVTRGLSLLAARQLLPLSVLSTRDISSSLVASQNTILLGSQRTNPWIGLFEDRTTFQTDYEEAVPTPTMRFVNRSPLLRNPPPSRRNGAATGIAGLSAGPESHRKRFAHFRQRRDLKRSRRPIREPQRRR